MTTNCNADQGFLLDWVQAVFRDTPDMVFIKDINLRYLRVSQSLIDILGFQSMDDVVGHTDYEVFQDHALAERYVQDDRRMIASGKQLESYVEPLPIKSGKPSWGLTRKGLIHNCKGDVIGIYGFSQDITAMVELENSQLRLTEENTEIRSALTALQLSSEKDPMTQLLNHNATLDKMKAYLSGDGKHEKHALMLLDLDNFKSANDQFGHQRGDDILAHTARSIAQAFRTTDIVGRIGGDEFLILMKDIYSLEIVRSKAAELISATQLWVEKDSLVVYISSSIGISLYNGDGVTFEQLYGDAENALSSAKELGKNRFYIWKDDVAQLVTSQAKRASAVMLNVAQAIRQWRKVLIAENDRDTCALLRSALERRYSVEFVSDGTQSLELLRNGQYSLFILGIQSSGWDVLANAQKDGVLRDIPILVILENDYADGELRALSMGASDVIHKPLAVLTLLARVQSAIARGEVRFQQEQNRLYRIQLQELEELARTAK